MRVLSIGQAEKKVIGQLVAYAESHRIGIHRLFAIMRGSERPPGDDGNFVCHLPHGFRCCFTIEQQAIGWCRHLSVSVSGDKYPNENAVAFLAKEFGFKHTMSEGKWHTDLEEHVRAVNVLERMEDTEHES